MINKNNKKVIYEIFFPAFAKDFKDLTDKVDYFEELGVTDVWLTPFYKSGSEHGYDIIDYKSIKDKYGTMEDFERFVYKMHSKRIGVMLDMVLCHTHYFHPLFQESIKEINDCYFWSDTQIDNQWRICHENGKYYYAPWSHNMPQLNLSNQRVRDMIEDTVKFWIGKGVDSFRLDAVIFARNGENDDAEFWKWFRDTCNKYKEDMYLLAEAWTEYDEIQKYANILGHAFNFTEAGWIKHSVNTGEPLTIVNNNSNNVIFLDSHDQSRIAQTFNGDMNKIKKAFDIMFSLDSDVCLYYMDELCHDTDTYVAPGGAGDHLVRKPMDWREIEYQRKNPDSLFNHIKKLIKEFKEKHNN